MTDVGELRGRLLAGLGITDRSREVAGVSTAVLEGGDGPPMILLHGPGEFAAYWLPVLDDLAESYSVIAPDLPGHGASGMPKDGLTKDGLTKEWLLDWLDELIRQTSAQPPILVGRVVGGAIGLEHAIHHPNGLEHLVLVDTLGLAPFDPAPRFMLAMERFIAEPTGSTHGRFLEFCLFDLDRVRDRFDDRWDSFSAYNVELAKSPDVQEAMGSLIGLFGSVPIASDQLAEIDVPTTLIWGRHDLATPISVAESASDRYGWPLAVVDGAGDDPVLDQPEKFLDALRAGLQAPTRADVS